MKKYIGQTSQYFKNDIYSSNEQKNSSNEQKKIVQRSKKNSSNEQKK